VSTAAHPDYRVRRAQLSRSVNDSQGFSVYDAIVDQTDWKDPTPCLSLLRALNDSQRAVVTAARRELAFAIGTLRRHLGLACW
jgi:hypothetical protein